MTRSRASLIAIGACLCLLAGLSAQAQIQVGEEFPIHVDSRGLSDMDVDPVGDGRVYTLTHPGATYIALHFAEFDLAPGDSVVVSDGVGSQLYTMTGKGKMSAGTFWAQHVKGDTISLRYVTQGDAGDKGFLINTYVAGYADLGGTDAICGTNDKRNAVCYETSHPTEYGRSRAVARLLIQGSSLCTGWLASSQNHLITNQHCIGSATAALNTDYEFMSEAPNCGDSNCQLCHAGSVLSGANMIQVNANLDYSLVQITSGNPSATYGHLSIDNRDAVIGEEIYIPQHPGGRAKELGIESSDGQDPNGLCHVTTFSGACTGTGYNDVGYQCDTEGGSSGSPVLARSSHKVIALHHCASCPNRGVPIDLVCAEVCDLLGTACTSNAECDDGNACSTDACIDNVCQNDVISPCCGDGACEVGEDCDTCGADCPSGGQVGVCGNGDCEPGIGEDCVSCAADCNGKQNGNPSRQYCCGDGDGTNPVTCGDSRCNAGGVTCDGGAVGFCCGDGPCETGESPANCEVDCGPPPPTCGQPHDPCDGPEDCCSGLCRRQGRCV